MSISCKYLHKCVGIAVRLPAKAISIYAKRCESEVASFVVQMLIITFLFLDLIVTLYLTCELVQVVHRELELTHAI
jgi:hypothetical protein